jgi:putative transposase
MDAPMIAAMKALSAQHPRYGYRRIRIFLPRQGHALSVASHASLVAPGGAAIATPAAPPAHHQRGAH